MASEPVEFDAGVVGLTLTAELYPLSAPDTATAGSPFTCTERTNNLGSYTFTAVGLTGAHKVRVLNGTATLVKTGVVLTNDTVLKFAADFANASLWAILWTAFTETTGLIAAAFKKFFNVATPTGTVNSIPDAVAGAAGGLALVGSAETLTTGERTEIANAILDLANGVETGYTLRQALRLIAAANAGKLSISGDTVTIRDLADAANRIVATTTISGQRTAVTLTP